MDKDSNRARRTLESFIGRGGISRHLGEPRRAKSSPEEALALISDAASSPSSRFDASVALALLGVEDGIPALRQVFEECVFPPIHTVEAQGYAALALALLRDVESIPRVKTALSFPAAGPLSRLALNIFESPCAD